METGFSEKGSSLGFDGISLLFFRRNEIIHYRLRTGRRYRFCGGRVWLGCQAGVGWDASYAWGPQVLPMVVGNHPFVSAPQVKHRALGLAPGEGVLVPEVMIPMLLGIAIH